MGKIHQGHINDIKPGRYNKITEAASKIDISADYKVCSCDKQPIEIIKEVPTDVVRYVEIPKEIIVEKQVVIEKPVEIIKEVVKEKEDMWVRKYAQALRRQLIDLETKQLELNDAVNELTIQKSNVVKLEQPSKKQQYFNYIVLGAIIFNLILTLLYK